MKESYDRCRKRRMPVPGISSRSRARRRRTAIQGRSVLAQAAARTGCSARWPASPSTRTTASGSCTGPARSSTTRRARTLNPPDHQVLLARAAGAAVRRAGQSAAQLGRPGRGLRLARERARHPRRPAGQRLARGQRPEGPADPQVHARRQVPAPARQAGQRRRLEQPDALGRPAHMVVDGRRALRRRRLREPAHRGVRRAHARLQAPLGRVRRASRTTTSCRRTIRALRSCARSATRCTACACRTTAWSTSATARTTASRCSRRAASS